MTRAMSTIYHTTRATRTGWKFLYERDGELRSVHGDHVWRLGEWAPQIVGPKLCERGYHDSPDPLTAFHYVRGKVVARTETRGAAARERDKAAHGGMRIARAWRWTVRDSVALAIYAADLVLPIFEQACPDDDRPRKAIEASRAWLAAPSADATFAYAAAADAAAAAGEAALVAANAAAYAAAYAAYAAAFTAAAAAYAANAAAASGAAYDAYDAYDAYAAAIDAADVRDQIVAWMANHVETECEEIKDDGSYE